MKGQYGENIESIDFPIEVERFKSFESGDY